MRVRSIMKREQVLPKVQISRPLSLPRRLLVGLSFVLLLGAAFFLGQSMRHQPLPLGGQDEFQQRLAQLSQELRRLKNLVQATGVDLAIEKNAQRHLLARLNAVETENAELKREIRLFVKLNGPTVSSKS